MQAKRLLPSYPLFVKDPYFQVWLNSEDISNTYPSFWNGHELPMLGLIKHGNNVYRFLGKDVGEPLEVIDINVNTYKSSFVLKNDLFKITLDFISPLVITNLDVMSNPSCIFNYKVETKEKGFEVIFAISSKILSNKENNDYLIRSDVIKHDGIESAYFAKYYQEILSMATDYHMAEYGYYYMSAKNSNVIYKKDLEAYLNNTNLDACKIDEFERYLISKLKGKTGKVVFSFDDVVSIYYYGEMLRNYYFNDNKTIIDGINKYYFNTKEILKICNDFDKQYQKDNNISNNYKKIALASYIQSVGAFKLVKDSKGRLLFLSKEISSDGCIATVDVTFPSMPLYLIYNPKLVTAMLHPIFDFARMKVWGYDFAPHDAGVYPYCNGQFYSTLWESENKEKRILGYQNSKAEGVLPFYYLYQDKKEVFSDVRQMPVEECSNMIICSYLASEYSNDNKVLIDNYDLLNKWADYLFNKGMIPDYQLCTDDFAGHLDKNVNLAIKAVVALKCFDLISKKLNKITAKDYLKEAKERVKKMQAYCNKTLPLAFDKLDTFSLKYNLAVDRLTANPLFSKKLLENETDLYIQKMLDFGVPLDSRELYTKVDWLMWCSSLTKDITKKEKIYESIVNFLENSIDRVPFSDWYYASSSKACMFKARSVVGGNLMPTLVKINNRRIK